MPELPEVTTTVKGLQQVLPKLVIKSVWTDLAKKNQKIKQYKDTIKSDTFFQSFKKKVIGGKIIKVERKAKNILMHVSGGNTILIHLKMTGHLIYGKYIFNNKENKWIPDPKERVALFDPFNRFIHVVFTFSDGKQLVFCDARKFGKVTIISTTNLESSLHLKNIGPEPLDKSFTFEKFKEVLQASSASSHSLRASAGRRIKTVLMDQSVVAGIGNIYSDEMLWSASIHPESSIKKIPNEQLLKLYKEMRDVLNKGIDFGGDSMSDYRNIQGLPGNFQKHHNVYQKKGERCGKKGCRGVIIRKVIGSRSAHFCSVHQVLFI